MTELRQVLLDWLVHRDVSDREVFGLQMFWWVRLGKLMMFAGGLTVVLEVLGAERVGATGARARARYHQALFRFRTARSTGNLTLHRLRDTNIVDHHELIRDKIDRQFSVGIGRVTRLAGFAMLALCAGGGVVPAVLGAGKAWALLVVPLQVLCGIAAFFAVFFPAHVAARLHLLVMWVRAVPSMSVFRPLAALLHRGAHQLRVVAAALLVSGFGLDLLGS